MTGSCRSPKCPPLTWTRPPDATRRPRRVFKKPAELTWWDWAVLLLHAAAEIEHGLLVQYLYAAYSLDTTGGTSEQNPKVAKWQSTILDIAKQEMGHLLTEQNLLRFIGAPLTFERRDFPLHSPLYPFPLSLCPLTKESLATYIAAEMPAHPAVPRIDDILDKATHAEGGVPVNRVGKLFDTLIAIFSDEHKLSDADLPDPHAVPPGPRVSDQADERHWHGSVSGVIVRTIRTRHEATDALQAIADQGEGSANPPLDPPGSHFDRFLGIYKALLETESMAETPWQPARPVPVNPNTMPDPDPDPHSDAERARITHPVTRLWAQLFNVRYRMLLTDLAHSLHMPGPFTPPTPRGQLCADAFLQMHGKNFAGGLAGIARLLTTLPLKETSGPERPGNAGPPFELPYTLALTDDEHGRWRMHLALLEASGDLITELHKHPGSAESDLLLKDLATIDAKWRHDVVEVQLAATLTHAQGSG